MTNSLFITNKNIVFDFLGMMSIFCLQIIVSFALIIVGQNFLEEVIFRERIISIVFLLLLTLLSYLQIDRIKNALLYFLPKEKYYIKNNTLIYNKVLNLGFYPCALRELEIPLGAIVKIRDRGSKRMSYISMKGFNLVINPIWFLFYFQVWERIEIETLQGKKYRICQYRKKPDSFFDFSADNRKSEEEFQEFFQKLEHFIQRGKNSYQQGLINQELAKKYLLEVEERYIEILKEILNTKKLYLNSVQETFSLYSPSVELALPDIFNSLSEYDFYEFYIEYLSNLKSENTDVEVGYNGVDSKKVTMKQLKEDINRLRDSN